MGYTLKTFAFLCCPLFMIGCSSAEISQKDSPPDPPKPGFHFIERIDAKSFHRIALATKREGLEISYSNVTTHKKGDTHLHRGTICADIDIASTMSGGDSIKDDEILLYDNLNTFQIASSDILSNESHASNEELWDIYMSRKHRILGAAFDDPSKGKLGRVAVFVWTALPTQQGYCAALREGYYYSSRGAKLSALLVSSTAMEIGVENWQTMSGDHVDFVGAGGQLLERVTSMPARYLVKGHEGYVRAHIYQSRTKNELREAWTQAYFLKRD